MDFCLLAYSMHFHLQNMALEYLRVIQELCTQLEVKLTHMDYALVSDNDDSVGITNETCINPEGIKRLRKVLKEKQIYELAVWSLEDEKNDDSPYAIQSEMIEINPTIGHKFVYIQFPYKKIENLNSIALFSFVSNLISSLNSLGYLDYALVTIMEPKMPQTYFRDIFAPGLNEEEAANLAMWNRRYRERKIRLRGLYWGNLLSRDHLLRLADPDAFKRSLELLVGDDQMRTINGDDLFFMMPFSDQKSGAKFDKVKKLLIENELLMQLNEEDIEEAREFLSY